MQDWNLLGPPVSKRATKVNGRTDGQTDAGDMVITKLCDLWSAKLKTSDRAMETTHKISEHQEESKQ